MYAFYEKLFNIQKIKLNLFLQKTCQVDTCISLFLFFVMLVEHLDACHLKFGEI